MVDLSIDLHSVLPHPEEGRGRPLQAEEGRLGEALPDLVALVPPASQRRLRVLLPQLQENVSQGEAPLVRAVEVLSEGEAGAFRCEDCREPGEERPGELRGEKSHVRALTDQGYVVTSLVGEIVIIELLAERQQAGPTRLSTFGTLTRAQRTRRKGSFLVEKSQ